MKKGEMPISQMRSPSASLQRLWTSEKYYDPYINLANAIVSVAADDYRTALKENNTKLKSSLEAFFFSDWFGILTRLEPKSILSRIQEEENYAACGDAHP